MKQVIYLEEEIRPDYPAQVSSIHFWDQSSSKILVKASLLPWSQGQDSPGTEKPQETKPDTNQAARTCSILPLWSPQISKNPSKFPLNPLRMSKNPSNFGPTPNSGCFPPISGYFPPNSRCFSLLQCWRQGWLAEMPTQFPISVATSGKLSFVHLDEAEILVFSSGWRRWGKYCKCTLQVNMATK